MASITTAAVLAPLLKRLRRRVDSARRSRRSRSSSSRPEFELSDKQFRVDFICSTLVRGCGFCKSWRVADCLAVDLPPPSLLAGFHTSGLLSPGLPARRAMIRLSSQAVTVGVSKPPSPRMCAMLPLTGATTSNIPRLVGQHDNIIRLDPRFVETGVARSAGVSCDRKISILMRLACKRINDA